MSLPPGIPREHVGVPGTIYLLHFDPPYKHARHYLGWTEGDDPWPRIIRHLQGQGSPLVRAAVESGSLVTLARTWSDSDRYKERRIKNGGGLRRVCPVCRDESTLDADAPVCLNTGMQFNGPKEEAMFAVHSPEGVSHWEAPDAYAAAIKFAAALAFNTGRNLQMHRLAPEQPGDSFRIHYMGEVVCDVTVEVAS